MKLFASLVSTLFVILLAACSAGADPEPTSTDEGDLRMGGFAAKGDSCSLTIDCGPDTIPIKEPGTDDGNGHCCSVFDSTKCQDLPKTGLFFAGASGARR